MAALCSLALDFPEDVLASAREESYKFSKQLNSDPNENWIALSRV